MTSLIFVNITCVAPIAVCMSIQRILLPVLSNGNGTWVSLINNPTPKINDPPANAFKTLRFKYLCIPQAIQIKYKSQNMHLYWKFTKK